MFPFLNKPLGNVFRKITNKLSLISRYNQHSASYCGLIIITSVSRTLAHGCRAATCLFYRVLAMTRCFHVLRGQIYCV